MKNLNKTTIIASFGTMVVGLFIGWLIFSKPGMTEHIHSEEVAETSQIWTCSMHPSIRQNEFGKCPICGMDLITVSQDGDDEISIGN